MYRSIPAAALLLFVLIGHASAQTGSNPDWLEMYVEEEADYGWWVFYNAYLMLTNPSGEGNLSGIEFRLEKAQDSSDFQIVELDFVGDGVSTLSPPDYRWTFSTPLPFAPTVHLATHHGFVFTGVNFYAGPIRSQLPTIPGKMSYSTDGGTTTPIDSASYEGNFLRSIGCFGDCIQCLLWPDCYAPLTSYPVPVGADADTAKCAAMAWGDYDGDGDEELFLVGDSGDANVLLDVGYDDYFFDRTPALLADTGDGSSVSWGDFDNDGDLDLLVAGIDGPNRVFENIGSDGDGWRFDEVSSGALASDGQSVCAAWVDYDLDGRLDIYVANRDGANQLLLGGLDFAESTPQALVLDGPTQGFHWCDFDQDGDPDLGVVTIGEPFRILEQVAPGEFTVTELEVPRIGQGCSWADTDNDGDFDAYVTVWGDSNVFFENRGPEGFHRKTDTGLEDIGPGRTAVWGDINNDRWVDVYLCNRGEANSLYTGRGPTIPFGQWRDPVWHGVDNSTGAGWCDVDRDGWLDLLVGNHGGTNWLVRNNRSWENPTGWFQVEVRGHPLGHQSNRSGIGAIVRIESGGVEQSRFVSGAGGNPLVQHFGISMNPVIDRVTVVWPWRSPDGEIFTTTLENVDIKQRITIVEENRAVSGVDDGPHPADACRRLSCYPNPFNPGTTIRFELDIASTVSLGIYDLAGRLIRTLADGARYDAGTVETTWSGRDDAGRSVAAGVYFCRLEAKGIQETLRMTLVK